MNVSHLLTARAIMMTNFRKRECDERMYDFQRSDLYKLLRSAKKHRLPKGQSLQISDDQMFFVLITSGYVKRYLITGQGDESIQSIYGPDTTFPLTPVFEATLGLNIYKGDETLYYKTMMETTLYSITKQSLQKAIEDDSGLYKDLFYAAGLRLDSNIQRLENMSLKSAQKRVIDMLLYFAENFSYKSEEHGVVIDVPLTHQTIADILNIARETVSNTIGRLHDRGLVSQLPKFHVAIPNIAELKNARH